MKIENPMYGGSIKLVFDVLKHQYSVNGKVVPGVTSALNIIAKPQLIWWAANMASDHFKAQITPGVSYDEMEIDAMWQGAKKAHITRKTNAATLGTMVHKWVESYIKGENPGEPVNEEMKSATTAFVDWVKEHNVKFLLSEQPVYSPTHNYAGTADFLCLIDGKLYLGDLKTSSGIYDEFKMQTSAYLKARVEEFPDENYEGIVVVRVGKEDGEFESKIITDNIDVYFDTFLKAKALTENIAILKNL